MPARQAPPLKPIPWLAANHIERFGALLERIPDARVLEVGAGGSTVWLAQRAARVVSIESNPKWVREVQKSLKRYGLDGIVEMRSVPQNQLALEVDRAGGEWDIVFIDCADRQRGRAIRRGARLVAPGGYLVADNANYANVRGPVERLRAAGWSVEIVKGVEPGRAWRHTLAICQREA